MVVITPECSNFSRAHWSPNGPPPIRSAAYPLGFPWLDPAQRKQADNHNSLISWTWEVLEEVARLQATKTITAFLEHPEDLGRIRSKGTRSHGSHYLEMGTIRRPVEKGMVQYCLAAVLFPVGQLNLVPINTLYHFRDHQVT